MVKRSSGASPQSNITRQPALHSRVPKARLRIRQRHAILYRILPAARYSLVLVLMSVMVLGGVRWIIRSQVVGALDFTPHTIGIETGAVGVQGISIGDLDGDGDQDIVTTGADGIKIYRNNGDFSFTADLKDDKRSERSQLIDIDDDDDLDILVTIKGSSPSVRWYENTGDLEFNGTSIGATGDNAVAYAGDLDGDGAVDIATAGREGDSIVLRRWMNNGSQTFTSTTLNANSKVTAVTIADTNDNGFSDIITGGDDGLQRWDTNDGITWSRSDIDDRNDNQTFIATADDSNGKTWIATVDADTDEVALYRSNDYGRLLVKDAVDGKTVQIVDLDQDGDLDLLVAAQDDNTIFVYKNDGSDHFTQESIATGLQSVYGVAAADMDGDQDIDVVTGDHHQGTVYVYERRRTKPEASIPDAITQGTNGKGLVSFQTTLSDGDSDLTRIRVQYSLDGQHWYKPWLTKVVVNTGTVDLKNSNGYQIGTTNPIDTNVNESVTLTMTWDTKSVENTGGPILQESDTVRLRIIARDNEDIGIAKQTGKFEVDNIAPTGLGALTVIDAVDEQITLTWNAPKDSNGFSYKVYYGTDQTAVLEQRSDEWTSTDDAELTDVEATGTTITGLTAGKRYTFKIVVTDVFGNVATAPSTESVAATAPSSGTTPTPTTTISPSTTPTGVPEATVTATPTPLSDTTPAPTPVATVTPTPTPTATPPPVLQNNNQPPIADAGPDQVVNPRALVILDGAASFDPDPGDSVSLSYHWRQLDGPEVEVLSDRTATPSFSAGVANETYIFSLTVGDKSGASAIDTVTIATKELVPIAPTQVTTQPEEAAPPTGSGAGSAALKIIIRTLNYLFFTLATASTLLLVLDRALQRINTVRSARSSGGTTTLQSYSRVVHYLTNKPIAGAQVLIYGADGKLRAQKRTNARGVFEASFPPGEYTLDVQVDGFAFAPAHSLTGAGDSGVIYTGGKLTVSDVNKPPTIIIPMKPTITEVTSFRVRLLQFWQALLSISRRGAWPLFAIGAMLNTVLIFFSPSFAQLVLEALYVVLVITKIATEVQVRPAYGQVRDAITHIPLDLAVVRLYEQETNRLVMTRVTNNQGRFFALPPAGTYMMTVSKIGYATFTKEDLLIESQRDTTLQMTADLMPVAPQTTGGLMGARGATI